RNYSSRFRSLYHQRELSTLFPHTLCKAGRAKGIGRLRRAVGLSLIADGLVEAIGSPVFLPHLAAWGRLVLTADGFLIGRHPVSGNLLLRGLQVESALAPHLEQAIFQPVLQHPTPLAGERLRPEVLERI